jgi:long-subunit acyl-CoA synthetase (AMP-forming)
MTDEGTLQQMAMGELQIKGHGYQFTLKLKPGFTDDGWFKTGDVSNR